MAAKDLTLPVQGMTCASCVNTVERALKKVEGVLSASVNLAAERATVEFIPTLVGVADFRQAISDVGYTVPDVIEESDASEDRRRQERRHEANKLRLKFIVSALLSVPLFFGSFPEWFPWVPELLQNPWTLLVLITPVQFWAGAQFYRGMFAALRHRTADMNTLIAVGTSAAYFYSLAVILFPQAFPEGTRALYLDTAAIIITLILLGRWLEARAKGQTGDAIRKLITHLGCLYKWTPSNNRFEYPCHGSKFSHDGFYIEGPAPRRLTVLSSLSRTTSSSSIPVPRSSVRRLPSPLLAPRSSTSTIGLEREVASWRLRSLKSNPIAVVSKTVAG